ncbi:N-6 DNA methylase [Stackebrandtia endophytica]|uniref:site-specific DNA-methyltransferase (adenine-specific) n=1 Tax=Stackebrandtia endophytica TaxID=1496996 RepID=A0A543ARD5_9ACTN|nr:DNA methyltransferase [Stackebrandtia endophytica]TQL75139.1 N-6 DNA methylase [Stackebrandtia endophytica]
MNAVASHTAVVTKGGLLPADLLERIAEGQALDGAKAADYAVIGRRTVTDDAERHWEYLKSAWRELRRELPDAASDPSGMTARYWLEPLFAELGFGRLIPVEEAGIPSDDGGKTFPISHRWGHVPIHFVDWAEDLESRPRAGRPAPHSLVQECLNRTDEHLWAIVTNGRQLRLLRDSSALAGTAYVEFDLAAIFDAELVSEFVLLYRLLHVSRFEVVQGAPVSTCWLEKWRLAAIADGVRALDQLRDGVERALRTLGTGFLSHPRNGGILDGLDATRLHKALLRLTYRLLFLFVAEDREALHPPDADETAVERYRRYYSTARLRDHARRRRGTSHSDQYQALRLVLDALGSEGGQPRLAIPGLGGLFDHTEADTVLDGMALSNEYLLRAVRHLAVIADQGTRRNRVVDYRHLDAEELGSVYESLLELEPKYSRAERRFELVALSGNQRKTTGAYYTPSPLIDRLLDTTLDPVIDATVERGEQHGDIERELLGLTVCDPACGSGHFLVAAARRIAKRLASVREQTPEPTPTALRGALRDVIGRCIFGVDINPMAVELAKVSLWLEALEPGKPLGFLDAHIKCGNALVGALPSLVAGGVPDEAWTAIEGDDRKYAAKLKKRNKAERERSESGADQALFSVVDAMNLANTELAEQLRQVTLAPDGDLSQVRAQAKAYERWSNSSPYLRARGLADTWCAAFFWHKTEEAPPAPTHEMFRELTTGGFDTFTGSAILDEATRLRNQHGFFHWHLEFPEVFDVPESVVGVDPATGWNGGFSAVVGNPPWENIELKEQEFFAIRDPDVAILAGGHRKKAISELHIENPNLAYEYKEALRKVKALPKYVSNSGNYPLYARGMREVKGANRYKTDALFTELVGKLTTKLGQFGLIVPTGIATDAVTQFLFRAITHSNTLVAVFDFENQARRFFPAVHASYKFCIFSVAGQSVPGRTAKFAFFLHDPAELDVLERSFTLKSQDIVILNPNTGTCPTFRRGRDAELTLDIYRQVPVAINRSRRENPWNFEFRQGLFNITDDHDSFRTTEFLEAEEWLRVGNAFHKDQHRMLPMHEGRMGHHYNHRFSNSDSEMPTSSIDLKKPDYLPQPEFWVADEEVNERAERRGILHHNGILVHRRVARTTDERTAIASIIPFGAVSNGWIITIGPSPAELILLVATYNSFVYDYCLRNSLTQPSIPQSTSEQLPVPLPSHMRIHQHFITPRVLELTYTAYDMTPFARDLGDNGPPFVWVDERRAVMRAELDALFFLLYGIERDDVDYIMETFPIVKKKDIAAHGNYLTKDRILAIYDRMTEAGVSIEHPAIDGENFASELGPLPGNGPRHPPQDR